MSVIPTGTELSRPFLPAKDFDSSKAFYEALGFRKLLDSDVAIFASGSGGFILQRAYEKAWAENFMMQLMVDDLAEWWAHIERLDLPGRFDVPAPKPPAMQPGGLRIAYIVDPSGVLWHIAESRKSAVQGLMCPLGGTAHAMRAAQGTGTPRSLQIFFARSSLISEWRGTAELLPAGRFTNIEWLAPSRSSSHPWDSRCRTSARRFTHRP